MKERRYQHMGLVSKSCTAVVKCSDQPFCSEDTSRWTRRSCRGHRCERKVMPRCRRSPCTNSEVEGSVASLLVPGKNGAHRDCAKERYALRRSLCRCVVERRTATAIPGLGRQPRRDQKLYALDSARPGGRVHWKVSSSLELKTGDTDRELRQVEA